MACLVTRQFHMQRLMSVLAASNVGAVCLGMTGLGTGAGGLSVREAIFQQCDGIEDALSDLK